MSRWPVLTCSIPLLAGCASVTPGLANAPRLGGSGVADERIGDAVSNGHDACGVNAQPGALRNQLPGCPAVEQAPAAAALRFSTRSSGGSLVLPWLRHFYVGWPCDGDAPRTEVKTVAWTPPVSSVSCLH